MTFFHATVAWDIKEIDPELKGKLSDHLDAIFGNQTSIAKTFEGYICASFTFASYSMSSAMLKTHNVCDVAGDVIDARIYSITVQYDDVRRARPL